MSDDENYQLGATGKLYIVKSIINGKPFATELHSGHRYQGINNPDTSNHDLTFVKFISLSVENKLRLDKFARQETSHSADAAFEVFHIWEHVVRYIDYVPNMHAIVTERLDWKGINPSKARFSDEATLDIAWDMIQALAYIHGRGIVHGDVRPENILPFPPASPAAVHRAKKPRYKLIGHGLVPRVLGERSAPGLRYTAPELRSQTQYKPTFRSDIWMLGMVLLECHTHGPAFLSQQGQKGGLVSARTISERAAAGKTIARLDQGSEGCGGHTDYSHRLLSDLLQRMLDTNSWRRWTAEELLDGMAHARWNGEERAAAQREARVVKKKVLIARKEVWKATIVGKVFRGVRMVFQRVFVLLAL